MNGAYKKKQTLFGRFACKSDSLFLSKGMDHVQNKLQSGPDFMPLVKCLARSTQYIKPLGFRMFHILRIQTLCRWWTVWCLIDEGEWLYVWDERCRTRDRVREERPCLFTRPTHWLIWHIEATLPFWATCLWASTLLSHTHTHTMYQPPPTLASALRSDRGADRWMEFICHFGWGVSCQIGLPQAAIRGLH